MAIIECRDIGNIQKVGGGGHIPSDEVSYWKNIVLSFDIMILPNLNYFTNDAIFHNGNI